MQHLGTPSILAFLAVIQKCLEATARNISKFRCPYRYLRPYLSLTYIQSPGSVA